MSQSSRIAYLFPRVRIRDGSGRNEYFTVGRITVLPDTDDVWQTEFSRTRPPWLQIFRDFPHTSGDRESDPARGSILIANDDDWLQQHISRIVGLFYYFGLATNHWRVPSEALAYFGFQLTDSRNDLVELATKIGPFIEHSDSIQIFPPLELRGVGSTFNLSLEKPMHQELLRRFFGNPYDNLAVACFHLCRTQWGNFLHSPHEQDFAAYCACLEAALEVRDDYPKNIYKSLRSRYDDHPGLDEWVRGLYSERSVFNHGTAIPLDPKSADPRMQVWIKFRKRRGNWGVMRELCRDVIHRTLEPYGNAIHRQFLSGINLADRFLRQLLLSQDMWSEVSGRFTRKGSVKQIQTLTDETKDEWINLALEFERNHDWRFVPQPINEHRLICVLRTAAAGMGLRAQNLGDDAADTVWSSLYVAASSGKKGKIRDWLHHQKRTGRTIVVPETIDSAILKITTQIASHFEHWH